MRISVLLSISLHIITPVTINRLLEPQIRDQARFITNYKEETNWDRTVEDSRDALFNHLLPAGDRWKQSSPQVSETRGLQKKPGNTKGHQRIRRDAPEVS